MTSCLINAPLRVTKNTVRVCGVCAVCVLRVCGVPCVPVHLWLTEPCGEAPLRPTKTHARRKHPCKGDTSAREQVYSPQSRAHLCMCVCVCRRVCVCVCVCGESTWSDTLSSLNRTCRPPVTQYESRILFVFVRPPSSPSLRSCPPTTTTLSSFVSRPLCHQPSVLCDQLGDISPADNSR